MRTLLLGMGNPILCDDAVGVRLAQDIGSRLAGIPGLDVVAECSVGGLNLLDVIAGYDRLIVIDSIKTMGGTPGSWYRLRGGSLRRTMHLDGVHDTNFATALELGRRMGTRLPGDDEIHIFAVEIEENSEFGTHLSARVEAAYSELGAEILEEIRGLLAEAPPA